MYHEERGLPSFLNARSRDQLRLPTRYSWAKHRSPVAAHETELASAPRNAAAQLSLAYLLEATGNRQRAEKMWSMLVR
jgi:hypothetical protein